MKLKNVWKYVGLLGVVNLIFILLYFIGVIVVCGIGTLVPLWASQWFGASMFLIIFSVFIAAIGNIREIVGEVIEFLKD